METATLTLLIVWLLLFCFYMAYAWRCRVSVQREFEIQAWADDPKQFIPLSSFLKRFGDFDKTMRLYSSIDPDDSYPRIYMEYTGPGMGYIQIIDTLKEWSRTEKVDFDIREKEAPKSWKDHVKRVTLYEITGGRVTNMREGYFK